MATRSRFWLGVALVMVGCCVNNVFLEYLVIGDRGAGQLLTLLQFVFIAILSASRRVEWRRPGGLRVRPLTSPLWWYAALTAIFWTVSLLNNMAYDYDISQPLHMVFRSSSLAVSLLQGVLLFGKRYSRAEVLGVVVVTAGVFITTLADATPPPCGSVVGGCSAAPATAWLRVAAFSPTKIVGVLLLVVALALAGLLGHLQAWGYRRWPGADTHEAMFSQHFLAIFFFAPFTSSLGAHAALWSASEPWFLGVPWLWLCVVGNVVSQYVCIRGVYVLVGSGGPLTATLVLTCRKCVSLLLSVWLFAARWGPTHWAGSALVFGGSLLYALDWPEAKKAKTE